MSDMSPTRREELETQIERCLLQNTDYERGRYYISRDVWSGLVDKLVALCQSAPLSRAQVEAVFAKHDVFHRVPWASRVIDDLLALGPQGRQLPDLTGLLAILLRYQLLGTKHLDWTPALEADLMAWALGREEAPPVWCKDIEWSPGLNGQSRWTFWATGLTPYVVHPECDRCLVCGAQRPTGRQP